MILTDESKHTIRIGEYKLFGLASHLVITGHDETGAQIWVLNGLATGKNGQAKSIGMPWDSSDTIKGYLTLYPLMGDEAVNQTTIVIGTPEEIESFKERAMRVIDDVNARDLDYRVDTQNSNSFAGTVLKAFGIEPQQLLNSSKHKFVKPVPGFTSTLLGDEQGQDSRTTGKTNHKSEGNGKAALGKKEASPTRASHEPNAAGRRRNPSSDMGTVPPSPDALRELTKSHRENVAAAFLKQPSSEASIRGEPNINPFLIKRPRLKQQAELLERDPALVRQLIVRAGRNP